MPDLVYRDEALQRLSKVHESISNLNVTLERLANTYRTLGEGMVADDITLPAIKLVAGLSSDVETLTGTAIVDADQLKGLESHQNLNFMAADVRTNAFNSFNDLFTLRQRSMVNLANQYRMWIVEQAKVMAGTEPTANIENHDCQVQQDEILQRLLFLLPSGTSIPFEQLACHIKSTFTEVGDAIAALTLPDFDEYLGDIASSAVDAVVNGKDFNIPKFNIKQILGSKTTYATPHLLGDTVIRSDADNNTVEIGFVPSDQHPSVKRGCVNPAEMTEVYQGFLVVKGDVGKLLSDCDSIAQGAWLTQLGSMATKSVMEPDEYLMYLYGDNLPGGNPDQYEKSARYVGQLLSVEVALSYMSVIAELVQVISFASPIIMNYCVTLSHKGEGMQ